MKKLGILFIVFALALVSCGGEETISEKETRLAKEAKKALIDVPVTAETELIDVPTSVGIAPVEETIEKVVHVTYTTVSTDSSYWFVKLEDNKTHWHGNVKFATPYFDFIEARKQFPCEGKVYFHFILQITKESYISYDKNRQLNHSL